MVFLNLFTICTEGLSVAENVTFSLASGPPHSIPSPFPPDHSSSSFRSTFKRPFVQEASHEAPFLPQMSSSARPGPLFCLVSLFSLVVSALIAYLRRLTGRDPREGRGPTVCVTVSPGARFLTHSIVSNRIGAGRIRSGKRRAPDHRHKFKSARCRTCSFPPLERGQPEATISQASSDSNAAFSPFKLRSALDSLPTALFPSQSPAPLPSEYMHRATSRYPTEANHLQGSCSEG